jgi:hypothetical protein
MARPLRLEFPGALYHVTARGNAQQAIFLDEGERKGEKEKGSGVFSERYYQG